MYAFGMTALGAVVGAIVTMAIDHIDPSGWSNLRKTLTTVLSATLAGTVVGFIDFMGGRDIGPVVSFYPVGLLLGVMWQKAAAALHNLEPTNSTSTRVVGGLHLTGLVVVTLFVVAVLFSPGFRSLLPADNPAPHPSPTTSPK